MKTIIVEWVKFTDNTKDSLWSDYTDYMSIIESDHKRFKKGTRFDFGFFTIAINEGYTIISLPPDLNEEI